MTVSAAGTTDAKNVATCVAVRNQAIPAAGASAPAKRHDASSNAAGTSLAPDAVCAFPPQRDAFVGTGRKERGGGAGGQPAHRVHPVGVRAQDRVELAGECQRERGGGGGREEGGGGEGLNFLSKGTDGGGGGRGGGGVERENAREADGAVLAACREDERRIWHAWRKTYAFDPIGMTCSNGCERGRGKKQKLVKMMAHALHGSSCGRAHQSSWPLHRTCQWSY